MMEHAWLVPLFPLIAFIILTLLRNRLQEGSAWIGIALTLGSFILSVGILLERLNVDSVAPVVVEWLRLGDHVITMGFEITPLNALMLVIVSLVSFLVHIYARGYMHGDNRISVFYAYLGLFTFSMLGLVISPNLLQLYIFWELVGVCSFLLVGFYFYKPEAKAAAKKAFIMTRIGDIGLFVAILLLFWQMGSFDYAVIFDGIAAGQLSPEMLALIGILVFVGAIGKSGQFPLHTWLPDAMEGPTPVSALIHAATMVAAGVYLVAALFPLFAASPLSLNVVAYIGAFTAIFAASIALVQNDVKRVLAYSTISQLGYMMLALGAAGYAAGVFHLMTHAFFKALLFLAAGSVIHALHTQNIQEMGGAWNRMKWTGGLFLIGCLAIAGVPPFSGFFSKEEILLTVWQDGRIDLFIIALVTAFMTAFYMFRLFFLIFSGESRENGLHRVQESPLIMVGPMVVLGVLAVFSGFVNTHWFGMFLTDFLMTGPATTYGLVASSEGWILIVATLVSLAGIALAYAMYVKKSISAQSVAERAPVAYRLVHNKYYVDELYDRIFVKGLVRLGGFLRLFDRYIVEGLGQFTEWVVQRISRIGAGMQNGQVQTYGVTVLIGLVLLFVSLLLIGGYWR